MNKQKPEPRDHTGDRCVDLHSMFLTIQGEGPFAGHRAVFIRLAGCNLQCPGCDTEYTLGRRRVDVAEVAMEAHRLAPLDHELIVITGGEPLRQPILGELCEILVDMDYVVQIESNGVFAPDEKLIELVENGEDIHLIISPKTPHINEKAAACAAAFKYVLDVHSVDPDDGLPTRALEYSAMKRIARPPESLDLPIYLNPYDAKDEARNKANLRAVAESTMKHGYISGIQLHKLIGME